MTTSPNLYTTLLAYSLLSGVFLRVVHDALDLLILPNTASHVTVPIPPLPIQNTTTARAAIKKLDPPTRKRETVARLTVDLIFSLLCTVTVTLLLFGLNFGEMRWFVLPIIAAGYFAYGATVGRPIKALLRALLTVVMHILKTVLRLISAILKKGIRFLKKPIRLIVPPIGKLLAIIKRTIIKKLHVFSPFHSHDRLRPRKKSPPTVQRHHTAKRKRKKLKKAKLFFKNPLTKTKK